MDKEGSMKWFVVIVGGLVLMGLVVSIVMAVLSQQQPSNLGLQNGRLKACPDSPNCVCSESNSQSDAEHFIQAMTGNAQTWVQLQQVLLKQGGDIQITTGDYMHVTFNSAVFHYVDDVEVRFDKINSRIYLRSASRVGRSDFGVNRKRIENIKKALEDIQ